MFNEMKIEKLNPNKVIVAFANKDYFADMLDGIAHRYELDMLVVYKQIITNDDEGLTTRTIGKSEMDEIGLTIKGLDAIAKANTAKLFPAVVDDFFGMTVLTNTIRNLGASVILYSEIVKQTAEAMGSDIYLIPSSIHEFLALPVEMVDTGELTATIRSINGSVVTGKDILSDHPYLYSREQERLIAV